MRKKRHIPNEEDVKRVYYVGFLQRMDTPWGLDQPRFEALDTDRGINRRRSHFVFDALRIERLTSKGPDEFTDLAFIHVSTTFKKFSTMAFGPPETTIFKPAEGGWYLLGLASKSGGPRAVLTGIDEAGTPLNDAKQKFVLTSLIFITEFLDGAPSAVPRILPPFNVDDVQLPSDVTSFLLARYSLPQPDPDIAPPGPELSPKAKSEVIALDVGQANCVILKYDGKVKTIFDVGIPLPMNLKSLPPMVSKIDHTDDCIIVLSHWDYDHYGLATREPGLKRLVWLAPSGVVGPIAKRFADSLIKLKTLTHGTGFQIGNLSVEWGTGLRGDKNNTGMIGLITIDDKKVLLSADTSYQFLPKTFLDGLSALTIPHHGSKSTDNVPLPLPGSRAIAVVCSGEPNKYKHPSEDVLRAHEKQGWKIEATGYVRRHRRRGDKDL